MVDVFHRRGLPRRKPKVMRADTIRVVGALPRAGVSCAALRCGRRLSNRRAVKRQSDRINAIVRKTEFVTKGGELVKGERIMELQRSVPGCGPLLSAAWLAQVGDASRFKVARQVTAFCGFDPSLMVSAGKVTKHSRRKGNVWLHYMIKMAARRVINARREALGQWGHALAQRHRSGGYNKAVGAVGRKIATGLWICHRDLVTWSYDSYDFWRPPDVPDVAITEVGFSPQVLRILAEKGKAAVPAGRDREPRASEGEQRGA